MAKVSPAIWNQFSPCECLNELQIPNHIELRNRYTNSKNHPDTVTFNCSDYSSIELDVSVAHPLSGNTEQGAAVESPYAAEKKELRKEQKDGEQVSRPCIPLVFEFFGFGGCLMKIPWTKYQRSLKT